MSQIPDPLDEKLLSGTSAGPAHAKPLLELVELLRQQGNLADAAATPATQVESEAGTEPALRAFSPLRIKQAIDALGASWSQTFGSGGSISVGDPFLIFTNTFLVSEAICPITGNIEVVAVRDTGTPRSIRVRINGSLVGSPLGTSGASTTVHPVSIPVVAGDKIEVINDPTSGGEITGFSATVLVRQG